MPPSLLQRIKHALLVKKALHTAELEEKKELPTLPEIQQEENIFEHEGQAMKPLILKKRSSNSSQQKKRSSMKSKRSCC